jgi:flagellar biosynthetic protein FlhB
MTGTEPASAALTLVAAIFELAFKATAGLLVLAVADYAYQRWDYERSLRMTRQEIKDEYREAEGDPQLRARIRRTQRQMATRRMMQRVPLADVVLTNPTHVAVAISYDATRMAAPVIVAKGEELLAQRIKAVAAEHGVPLVENRPLARALNAACELDEPVPPDLYQAVAEVLAFIYSLKRRRPPADTPSEGTREMVDRPLMIEGAEQ